MLILLLLLLIEEHLNPGILNTALGGRDGGEADPNSRCCCPRWALFVGEMGALRMGDDVDGREESGGPSPNWRGGRRAEVLGQLVEGDRHVLIRDRRMRLDGRVIGEGRSVACRGRVDKRRRSKGREGRRRDLEGSEGRPAGVDELDFKVIRRVRRLVDGRCWWCVILGKEDIGGSGRGRPAANSHEAAPSSRARRDVLLDLGQSDRGEEVIESVHCC